MLLNKAMPIQSNNIAKKGDQRAILAVLPNRPQTTKEMITITHHGAISCKRKEAINIIKKTIVIYL
jgi:hypothetical protein